MPINNILSIDVEDWFHILDIQEAPPMSKWANLPSRVETNFIRLLDVMDEHQVKSTCFFLAWTVERFPHLVTEAVYRGHEIASHGYEHKLVYQQSPNQFLQDISKAKAIIEDAAGCSVNGYRAPGFSVTEGTPWFFEMLAQAGYGYDSSVFPAARGHGGIERAQKSPYPVSTPNGEIVELPVTVGEVFRKRYCFCGGGYFRLFPYFWIAKETRAVNRENLPVIVYLHPRDIDPDQPRIPMSRYRRFKSYVNLHATLDKLKRYLNDFPFSTFENWLKDRPIGVSE